MTFLNATLIFGALAAGVPIVLHLIARKDPKPEVFPAVRFLRQRLETNRTRLKVRRWWLLALRILALAALAFALARPLIHRDLSIHWLTAGLVLAVGMSLLVLATLAVFRGGQRSMVMGMAIAGILCCLGGLGWSGYTIASGVRPETQITSPVALGIIVDNSVSSSWTTNQTSHLDRARQQALSILERLPETSRVVVVDRSSRLPAFAVDVTAATAQVQQIRPLQVTTSMEARIQSVTRVLNTSDLETRGIVILTNLNESTWNALPDRVLPDQGTVSGENATAISVTVLDVGEFDDVNRGITLRTIDTTPPKNLPHPIAGSVTLSENPVAKSLDPSNESSIDSRQVGINLKVELQLYEQSVSKPVIRDGEMVLPDIRTVDRKTLTVVPGRRVDFVLTTPPLPEGTHHAVLRLIGDDPFANDNQQFLSLHVGTAPRVLVVGADSTETSLIAQTVTAPRLPEHPDAEFQVDEIQYADLRGIDLNDYAMLALLNPSREVLREESLRRYVEQGGRCLVSLGPEMGTSELAMDGLPVIKRIWRIPDDGTFFQIMRPAHPILAPLAGSRVAVRWSDFRIQRYWQLETSAEDDVLIQFAGTEHPALLSRQQGDGQWMFLATSLTIGDQQEPWNDLYGVDSWPTFVLVRQITEFLARRYPDVSMTDVGYPISLPLHRNEVPGVQASSTLSTGRERGVRDVSSVTENASEPTVRWQLFEPGATAASPIRVPRETPVIRIAEVPRAGTYWLRSRDSATGFSANPKQGDLKIARADMSVLHDWFGEDGFDFVDEAAAVEFTGGQGQVAVSLRSPVMLFALAVFLLEQLLGNRFYRQSDREGSDAAASVERGRPGWFSRIAAPIKSLGDRGARPT